MATGIEMLRQRLYGNGPSEVSVDEVADYFEQRNIAGAFPEEDVIPAGFDLQPEQSLPIISPEGEMSFEEEEEEGVEDPDLMASQYADEMEAEALSTGEYQKRGRRL